MRIVPLERPPHAAVTVPGSKSLTNRALLCAALASGQSTLSGSLHADDTEAMAGALRTLGVDVSAGLDRVDGCAGHLPVATAELDVKLSGTAARFLAPVLTLGSGPYRLDGSPPLRRRPIGALLDALRVLGATVEYDGDDGHLPARIGPSAVDGGTVRIPGDVTSQFVSALLLAGPCWARGVTLEPTSPLVSMPYLRLTASVMRAFGASIDGLHADPGGYRRADYAIEPDASSASYFFAAAALTGGTVAVSGLARSSEQGDVQIVDVLERMGAEVQDGPDGLVVTGPAQLDGGTFDLRDMPDMALTLAALAPFASSPVRVIGVGFIRGHETDRIRAAVTELGRCGIVAEEEDDGFIVHPGTPEPARIETYDDHRMAMSFALVGLRVDGIDIADPECVGKTFPSYFETLDRLR